MSPKSSKKPILTVSDHEAGQRVDNYLFKHRKQLDKSTCYKLMRKGQIRINGKRTKPSCKLAAGDEVRMPPFVFFVETHEITVNKLQQQELLQRVIFEDDDYLVLNKPAGLPVHKGSGHDVGVIEIINSFEAYKLAQLAHRLDKDTSGCLVLAKNRQSLLSFQQALQQQEVTKLYVAVLTGRLSEAVEVNQPLDTEHRVNGIRHVIPSSSGQSAQTYFQPVTSNGRYTLTQCRIVSGRTHQIRVHAKFVGHPVLGDRFYGVEHSDVRRSLFLHAQSLAFAEYKIEAPLPSVFEEVLIGEPFA